MAAVASTAIAAEAEPSRKGAFSQVYLLAVLMLGWLPWLWAASADALVSLNLDSSNQILHTAMFLVLNSIIDTVVDLPWSLYHTFVLEARFGFNRQVS